MLIEGGAELEMGWLPPLLQNARNPKIEIGKPGRVRHHRAFRLMNVPAMPLAPLVTCTRWAIRISDVDPIIAKAWRSISRNHSRPWTRPTPQTYDANSKKFEAAINAKLQEWGTAMLPFKGQRGRRLSRFLALLRPPFRLKIDCFWNRSRAFPPRRRTWPK